MMNLDKRQRRYHSSRKETKEAKAYDYRICEKVIREQTI